MKTQTKRRPDPSTFHDRVPPHSLDAEMALLGSMILDPRVIGDVLPLVDSPEAFYLARHGAIFSAIVTVFERHDQGDLPQILDVLRTHGQLDDIGGGAFLVSIADQTPSATNAKFYARIVADKAKLRSLIDASEQAIFEAFNVNGDTEHEVSEIIDRAGSALSEIAERSTDSEPMQFSVLHRQELDRLEAAEGCVSGGIATGFAGLDKLIGGLKPGEVSIVAARPSMGKTAFALNVAEHIAFGSHIPVGLFSLEMSKSAIAQRMLSAYCGIDSYRIQTDAMSADEFRMIVASASELAGSCLIVDDTSSMTILTLRARARRMVSQHHVRVILIDYIQLMTDPGSSRESRQVEVSAISRGIKALARELNIPIVCLSQLNRGAESRDGNRPRMSDLRESGALEQDADVVMLLHREAYYHRGDSAWDPSSDGFDERNRGKLDTAEIIVAKNRNGPTGLVQLVWHEETTRFTGYTPAVVATHTDRDGLADMCPQVEHSNGHVAGLPI